MEKTEQNNENLSIEIVAPIKKKRGRKKKCDMENSENVVIQKEPPKKRGRKPKGGKIVDLIEDSKKKTKTYKSNIILHLKCTLDDINNTTFTNEMNYNPVLDNVEPFNNNENYYDYNENSNKGLVVKQAHGGAIKTDRILVGTNVADQGIAITDTIVAANANITNTCIADVVIPNVGIANPDIINADGDNKILFSGLDPKLQNKKYDVNHSEEPNKTINIKELWGKLNSLSIKLHNNNIKKKSNCFWCTEPFDNPSVYIPRSSNKDKYDVYGSFCSPECAASYLFNEKIDNSTKFERYHLLNNIYCKIYDYKKNIKPAPSPYYLLEKFYGDMSIEEYRKLFKNDKIMIIIDKPMTKIYPELFEENDEYPNQHFNDDSKNAVSDNISSNNFRLYRKNTSKVKSQYLTDNFGL